MILYLEIEYTESKLYIDLRDTIENLDCTEFRKIHSGGFISASSDIK